MNATKLSLLACSAILAVSCTTTKNYTINSKSGTETQGTAKFVQTGKNVEMDLNVYKLTPGIHAVHIHEKGDCSSTDGSSAGGHWNPTNHDHGKFGSETFHMGDIGNLNADKEGTARLLFKTDKWCIGCKDETKNIIGKSLIIHAGRDDFKTQPTGNAGGRVGCIEIK
ncbi:superoxide dismutase family protein [Candidatus Kaistella beijingensis]|uniref:superoxide dismutase family protein n=1 Tax=Candidatus Kaistella beijingensis TaxID=2820270 RepID=UPI001CC4A819|nr:superoxide dismutase family protein [Candidatus Kaistella beijingensis]UBB89010.1 superoxide dismutase family protein [Candidatus Kaistella beijingensis]